jgi:predicted dehydrogenase
MSNPFRIVLVGCGGISNAWFNGLAGIDQVAIVGLVDLQEAAAQRRKSEHRLTDAKVGTDVASMLKETRPDIVFDCTVPEARASVVLAALRHGCHVLSEKPMADSMAGARRLIRAAEKARRFFAVMQNRRYDARIRALRSFLDSGAVGDLTTLNGDFYIGAHFGGFRDQMEHVLLLDMAIHSFDQARLISGADPVAVYCREWNPRGSWYRHDASAVAIFEMSNGIAYTYRGSWCAEGINTSWECDWRAVGTRGTVVWDGGKTFRAQSIEKDEGFFRSMREVTVPMPEISRKDGHAGCIRDFIECVTTGRVPETSCTENIKSLAMVFGAIKSARSGRRVAIKCI